MNSLPQIDLGPYHLQQFLARGGMGAVYVAHDPRLDRRVAVKHIPPEAIGDPRRRQRFRREAAILARLSHPAIVQIFDIVEAPDGDWIVMELVEGETVAQMLTAGPLPLRQAITLARQVAEGLTEAHAQGIIHRDLKTENVIVSPSGHAKILDFGVAKRLSTEDGETKSGQIVGTRRAMSPEQARSLPLDPRSDLFSLGVLLYEMMTAVAPFHGVTLLDTLTQVTSHPHVPVRTHRGEVSERLSDLVDRLLEKSPELRPESAHRVAAELSGLEASWKAPPPLLPARGDAWRETLELTPVPESDIGQGAPTWRRGRGKALWTSSRIAAALIAAALIAVLVAGLEWKSWQRWLDGAPDPARATAGATAPDSYALFQQGMAYLERFDKPGHLDRATAAFETAIAQDENSAPAHAGLALAYWRRYLASRDPLRLEQALAIAERAVRLDEHLALARMALGSVYVDSGRDEDALRELRVALRLEPGNAEAYRMLSRAHEHQGRFEEAIAVSEKAVELDSEDPALRSQLGVLYFRASRYDEAEEQILKSIELAPDGVFGYRNLSAVYYMQGRLTEAAEALQKGLEIKPDRTLYSNLGTIFFAQGLYPAATQAFEKALELGGGNYYLQWANLADAYRFMEGHGEKAREGYLRAIELLQAELETQPNNTLLQSRLALYRARRGDCQEALAGPGASVSGAASRAEDFYRLALVHEVCGEREKALAMLAEALRAGFSTQEIRRDPELFDLRSDPGYHHLMAEFGKR